MNIKHRVEIKGDLSKIIIKNDKKVEFLIVENDWRKAKKFIYNKQPKITTIYDNEYNIEQSSEGTCILESDELPIEGLLNPEVVNCLTKLNVQVFKEDGSMYFPIKIGQQIIDILWSEQ